MVVAAVAVAYSSRVAADSDAYGYVSQAELWMKGRLVQHDPLASTLGTRFSPRLLAPLGYVPGEAQGTIVPLYPPGLPMAMAAAGRLFGPEAIHLVVPACGGLLVGLAYVLGQRLGDRFSGLATAGLVAAHPSFLLQAIQPMSDVPAAAAWTAALAFASRLGGGPWPPLAAGLAASAAILIRPNLTPLAAAVALLAYLIDRPHGLRRVAAFAAGLVPGAMMLAAVNSALYGSPFLSGYGGAGDYLRVAHVPRNLVLYPRWLLETQGPLVFLSLLAPLAWLRSPLTESGERRPALPALVVFGGALAAIYALYLPFEDWPYVRFLLPGLPLALVLALAPLRTCLRPFATALRVPLLVAVVAASFGWSLRFTREKNVLDLSIAERAVRDRRPLHRAGVARARRLRVRALQRQRPLLRAARHAALRLARRRPAGAAAGAAGEARPSTLHPPGGLGGAALPRPLRGDEPAREARLAAGRPAGETHRRQHLGPARPRAAPAGEALATDRIE